MTAATSTAPPSDCMFRPTRRHEFLPVEGVGHRTAHRGRQLKPWQFLLAYTAFTAAAFQAPTFFFALSRLDVDSVDGWRTLATLAVLLALLMHALVGLPLLLSRRLAKLVALLLLPANALASYFAYSYGVVLSADMMGNVFRTSVQEAAALVEPVLLVWIGAFAVLPGWWLWQLRWAPDRRSERVAIWCCGLVGGGLFLYLNASSWLWLDRHMSRIGAMTPPWSYLINGGRFLLRERDAAQPLARLPDLVMPGRSAAPSDEATALRAATRRAVVLVIGESARAANFALYGYGRPTNPALRKLPVWVLPARACASYTTAALACMLSARGHAVSAHPPEETLPSYLHRHGVDVEWRTNNFGEPRMEVGTRLGKAELLDRCDRGDVQGPDDRALCQRPREGAFDDVLLLNLEHRIRASAGDQVLIVLHQAGSHGPAYHEKYPRDQEVFSPACKTVMPSRCPSGALVNAYDNSIRHTDRLLAELVGRLRRLGTWDATLIYVSDHGESLGEGGLYLHGTPAALAPDVQLDIPFLIWRSRSSHEGAGPRVLPGVFSHDHVFHTVLGALGLRSGAYRADLDVLRHEP